MNFKKEKPSFFTYEADKITGTKVITINKYMHTIQTFENLIKNSEKLEA